ncbi:MAG: hypothetical protein PWQ67_884 [Clostridia bacterium]|jgi:drug/metabolite transporter (DMT)-like permease|nr:hypothetical protein [Clostridia bacterium]MDN5322430.1 hypothetical protein [Clostridia bacterium]
MKVILAGGIALVFLGVIYYLPLGTSLIKNKTLPKVTGIFLVVLGVYLIFRALTL